MGLAWKSSYVARIAPDAATLDLTGWITLANHGGTSFANAPTSVVAGRLERQASVISGIVRRVLAQRRSAGCWPMGNFVHLPARARPCTIWPMAKRPSSPTAARGAR